jgi:SSS family transporter
MFESTADLVVLALYFLLLIAIGYYASRKVKGLEDYTIAGRRLGYPVLLGTLIGTAVGAAATIGKAGKAYELGGIMVISGVSYALGLFLFAFIAPIIRRARIWTIPDALEMRYGGTLRVVAAVVMILAVVALFGAQLIAVGLSVTAVLGAFGISYTEAIIGAGIIMVLYTMMGGLIAVAYTDLIQSAIMIVAVGILLPVFATMEIGGPAAAWNVLQPGSARFWGEMTVAYAVSLFLLDIAFCLIDPSLWQRAAAARNASAIRNSMFITSGIYILWSAVVVYLGLMAIHMFPGLGEAAGGADSAIPRMIITYMPPIIRGICLAAMMAIMMSTADTALLIAGTTFSRDIVQFYRPQTADRTLLIGARGFIACIGVLGVVFALNMEGIFDILLLAFAIFVSGIFIPTMAAFFWRKATRAGAIVSSIAASIAVVLLYGLKLSDMLPGWIEPIIISIFISFILMIGISIATYRPETATLCIKDRIQSSHESEKV